VTVRRVPIRRRSVAPTLDTNTESAAAGYLVGFWHEPGASARSYWESIAYSHGERIRQKVLAACPGTRPGFDYATGQYPPIPLLDGPPPPETLWARDHLDVEGVRFWYVAGVEGLRFVRCQAEHLRELGELDGLEWQRYLAWRRSGFEPRYVLDEHPEGEPAGLWHMCW
jgi:hypothetical protein